MIKGWMALAVAVLLAISAYGAWDYYVKVDHPKALISTENAFATDDLIALGSVSIEQAVRLETSFIGTPDTQGASKQGLLADTPFAQLQVAGIDPRSDLHQLVFALYQGVEEKPGYALAMLGTFSKDNVLAGLKREYVLTPAIDIHTDVWTITKQDIDSCNWSTPRSIYISSGVIMITEAGYISPLITRLEAHAKAQRDLKNWREFRSSKIGSMALFVPEKMPNTGNPFIQKPASEVYGKLNTFNEIYLGFGLWPVPFQAQLTLLLTGKDPHAAQNVASEWQSSPNDSKAKWGQQMPTVARLYDALSIGHDQGALSIEASVDKPWLKDAKKIPQEFLTLLLGGSAMSFSSSAGSSTPTERIDENPEKFVDNLSINALPDYQAKLPFTPNADTVSGPFGIMLSAIELSDQKDAGLELTVSAAHNGIANLGNNEERLQLFIGSVTDAQGNELMREENCGRERNNLPASISHPHFDNNVIGEKTVRLKTGTRHADIHRIHGEVKLSLPVNTETVRLTSLDQAQQIDRDNLRINLSQSTADTLDYKVYGDSKRLLAVRGLNKKGQPLSQSSSMSSGFLFGDGLSKNQSFAGQVASVELVLATRDVEKRFPFKLTQTHPRMMNNESTHAPTTVQTYSLAQLQRKFKSAPATPSDSGNLKAETVSGPFRIALNGLSNFMSLQTTFSVYAPLIPGLADNLTGMLMEITAVKNEAGENLIEGQPKSNLISFSEDWQDKTRLHAQANISFKERIKTANVHKIKGRLHLRLPKKIQSASMQLINVGDHILIDDNKITLKRIDDKGFILDFGTQLPPLAAINAYNAENKSIWVPHPRLEIKDERWTGHFNTHGKFKRIELLLASEQEIKTYDFELAL
jgi:hypothetical protein